LEQCLKGQKSIFKKTKGLKPFEIDSNIQFHMYISQSPCGDASMTHCFKNSNDPDINENGKRLNTLGDVVSKVRNGVIKGRCGWDLSYVGALRTKPGKTNCIPTACMSCSDKIMRWNVLGLQSSLLSALIYPIYLSTIHIGDGFDRTSLERALVTRLDKIQQWSGMLPYSLNKVTIIHSSYSFQYKQHSHSKPSHHSKLLMI
jgi:tRNA-specific adenosine deaminase 1